MDVDVQGKHTLSLSQYSLSQKSMFASLVSNKGSNYLVPKKYGDVMLIFLIFIVDSTINLYNKLYYKYEKKKHHVTIF